MPRLLDLLYRMRPAGVPGAPSATSVPRDRVADAEGELAPLFAALLAINDRCDETRAQAERDAASARERAQHQVDDVLAEARRAMPEAEANAAAQVQADVEATVAAVAARAQAEARELRTAARRRSPAMVSAALDVVRGLLDQGDALDHHDSTAGAS